MKITVYSCWIAILWSSIFIYMIRFIRKKYPIRHGRDLFILIGMYFLCFVRLAVPIDFSFTHGFSTRGIYASFFDFLNQDRFMVGNMAVSILDFLCILMYLAAMFSIIKAIIRFRKEKQILDGCPLYNIVQIDRVNRRIRESLRKLPEVSVVTYSGISVPVAAGIKNYKIVLPDMEYSDTELYYILLHEYNHILHHDLWIVAVLNLFDAVFWWLPGFSFLGDDLHQAIELKCDMAVTKNMQTDQRLAYMSELLHAMKRAKTVSEKLHSKKMALSFAECGKWSVMEERFRLISAKDSRKISSCWHFIPVIFLFFLSYSFILIPSYDPDIREIEEGGAIAITRDNSYITYENGQYVLYTEPNYRDLLDKELALQMIDNEIPFRKNEKDQNYYMFDYLLKLLQ